MERIEPSDDGREVRARWTAGKEQGPQRVTAIYRLAEEGAGTLVRTQEFYQYGDGKATAGPDAQREPICHDYMICDMAPNFPSRVEKSVPDGVDGATRKDGARGPEAGGAAVSPSAALHHELPLPLRYVVDVRCLADYGETLLLEAKCPPEITALQPSYLWHVSAGTIEPLDGGLRALWQPPDDGTPCVATCAVQSVPLDLQLGTWRRD